MKQTARSFVSRIIPALLFIALPVSISTARQTLNGGSIKGKIVMPPMAASISRQPPARYGSYSSTGSGETTTREQAPEATNVVVYLEGPGLDELQRVPRNAVLDQRNATFIPHVLPIVKGTTVEMVNRDKTYHNVFSLSGTKKFNIGRRPTGEEVPVTFDKTGTVQVFCDIHSHMNAYILVLENPAFVQPKADGTYSLDGIPPGKYTVHIWHERFSASPQNVTVGSGETSTVDFSLQ